MIDHSGGESLNDTTDIEHERDKDCYNIDEDDCTGEAV